MGELSYIFIFIFFLIGIALGGFVFKNNKSSESDTSSIDPAFVDNIVVSKVDLAFSSHSSDLKTYLDNKQQEFFDKHTSNMKAIEDRLRNFIISKIDQHAPVDNTKDNDTTVVEVSPPELTPILTIEESLSLIDSLIGMKALKQEINLFVDVLHVNSIREKLGKKPIQQSLHSVFYGSPGTGKTTVARLLGFIYQASGILSKGHVVEVSRSDLVSQYIGKTALQTEAKINEANGGILFIDEAYSLYSESGSDYGAEVVNTLIKRMEDDRGNFVVIMAGYKKEMDEFLNSNTGLKSRFTHVFHFETYTSDELVEIFQSYFSDQGFYLSNAALDKLTNIFNSELAKKDPSFGNARFARNLFDRAIRLQSKRIKLISETRDISVNDLEEIIADDIVNAKSFG